MVIIGVGHHRAAPPQATIQKDNLPVEMALARPSSASLPPLPLPSALAMATTSPAATASALLDVDSIERNVLERARASLGRAAIAPSARVRNLEIEAALAALADHERRFPNALYPQQRDLLRRQILAYQATLPVEDAGHR